MLSLVFFERYGSVWCGFAKKIVNLPQHNNYAKIKRIGEI